MTSATKPGARAAHTGRVHDRPRWLKRALGLLFVLGACALLVFAWLPKPIAVDTAIAERTRLVVTVDEDGRARVKDRYSIFAPLAGQVARIELHPGDTVTEGQLVARIAPTIAPLLDERSRQTAEARLAAANAARQQALARVERTRSALTFAAEEARRTSELAKQGVVSPRELERALLEERTLRADLATAEFGVKVATHELEMARAAVGHLTRGKSAPSEQLQVTSPIDGRVLALIRESEGIVQAGAPLIEVGDPAALEIVVDILTRDAVRVAPGAHVSIERWGGKDLVGRVRLVEPSAFTRLSSLGVEEQRVNAIIDLESPREDWLALGDGYRVEARIVAWQADDVLAVPGSAVFRSGRDWTVFVLEEGRARQRRVSIGERNATHVQLTSGIDAGVSVITHPSDRVVDGVEVVRR